MSKYHDDRTAASDPGGIRLSPERYARLRPAGAMGWIASFLGAQRAARERTAEHLMLGDSRAALVMRVEPLLTAVYTDELDCVAMLQWPAGLVREFSLKPGTRLLTVNTYMQMGAVARDLTPGPQQLGNYSNFYPLIADFFSDDRDRIEYRKRQIDEAEWRRCQSMGEGYLAQSARVRYRDGASKSATPFSAT